ncbi:MAG: histidinol-phosphate transaminase [Bacteroidota bacterium]
MKRTRRQALKTGLLSIGGLTLAPHLSFSESWRSPVSLDTSGNVWYSPFFKEFIDETLIKNPDNILAKLNANENPYGPSSKAIEAHKTGAGKGNRYAWKELFQLIDKIALKETVKSENIMMGPGSSDILEKTGILLFMEGGNIVSADPSYMSMINVAKAVGAKWKGIPLKEDWSHDLEAMEAAIDKNTKLVYICNPNNPTGSITPTSELKDFCSRVSKKVPVFVDEAYLDFLDDTASKSMVSLVNEGKNVMVARTFSKIHGMAGMRVGYMVAKEKTIKEFQKITRGGMGISYSSVMSAIASMDDVEFLEKSKNLNNEVREYVLKELKTIGFDCIKSYTSFIIFPIEMDGKKFLEQMRTQNVAVRAFEIQKKNWCRVSMGTKDEMNLFLDAINTVLV